MSIIGFSTKVSAVSGRLIVTEPINPLLVASIAGLVMWPIIAELARQPSRRGRLAIWATIADHDDWTPLDAKVAAIRAMGTALA